MVLVFPKPSACVFKAAPGEPVAGTVTINDAPEDPAAIVTAEGPAGALAVLGIDRSRQIRIPYTEEELRELPPTLRDRLRREGRLELVLAGNSSPGVPFNVDRGDSVVVRFQAAAVEGTSNITPARLVFVGDVWNRTEVPVITVIGRGQSSVTCIPSRVQVAVAPGQTINRQVRVDRAPVDAQVVVVLAASSPKVGIRSLTAYRYERREFTEEELEQLLPDMRERARQVGYEELVVVGRGEAGQPMAVPAGGMLEAMVSVSAPPASDRDGSIDHKAILIIESNNWRRVEVPVEPLFGGVSLELSGTRIEVRQGEGVDGPLLSVRSSGPATNIALTLGIPGDPWTVGPSVIPVAARASASARLHITAAPNAATGEHRADLKATWFLGLGDLTIPLTLMVRPGSLDVFPLQPNIVISQGGTATVEVAIHASSSNYLRFRPARLRSGVTLLPPDREYFAAGEHVTTLRLAVARYARPFANGRIVVQWDANDGQQTGFLELRMTVQLQREEKVFSAPIITPDGIPLGGHASLILSNDGSGRFQGHMRATGFPSFQFNVLVVFRSANGKVAFTEQESGAVYGTDSPGPRQVEWDRRLESRALTHLLTNHWPDVLSGSMATHRAFEFRGLVGTALDRLLDALDMMAALAVLAPVPGGSALAVLVLATSELTAGVFPPIGAGGLAGVISAGAALFVVGPSIIFPVFVAGAIAGAAAIDHRPAEPEEREFADQVFGSSLPWGRIRLTNLVGLGGAAFVCPNTDDQILVNLGAAFGSPRTFTNENNPVPGQLFIHELTHAWQIHHGRLDATFLWDGIIDKITGPDYAYGPAGPPFSDFGIEEKAALVEEWFAGRTRWASFAWPGQRQAMDMNDPYFRYISENIRLGRT